jgi:hypothetical protein
LLARKFGAGQLNQISVGFMNIIFRFFAKARFVLVLFCLAIISITDVYAKESITNCDDVEWSEAEKTQAEFCAAHPGCALVLKIGKTCTKVKTFLKNLNEQIGEGVRTLFGRNKDVTDEAVFNAYRTDEARAAVSRDPAWRKKSEEIESEIKSIRKQQLSGSNGKDNWVFSGEVQDGAPSGRGTMIYADGQMQRGNFLNGSLQGFGEVLHQNGSLKTGGFYGGKAIGPSFFEMTSTGDIYKGSAFNGHRHVGTYTFKDGRRFEGKFDIADGRFLEGKLYRANGLLHGEGTWRNDVFHAGIGYNIDGTKFVVDREADLRKAAEEKRLAQAEADKARLAQAAQDKAAREQAFRDSLKSLNAGQLYAKADELKSSGQTDNANIALRQLISTYPDHQLSMKAAELLAPRQDVATAEKAGTAATQASSARNVSSPSVSGGKCTTHEQCVIVENASGLDKKMAAFPRNDTVLQTRSIIFAADFLISTYQQCTSDVRCKGIIVHWSDLKSNALRTCQQISNNPNICTVSPF